MKRTVTRILALVGFISLTFAGVSYALTAAGTTVTNQASVAYKVGGIDQTAVPSKFDINGNGAEDVGDTGSTTFTVDRKVDLTVVTQDISSVSGLNGATVNRIFRVTNTSNETLRFALTATNAAATTADPFGGAADSVDAQSFTINAETAQGNATYTGGAVIASLPAGEYRDVQVATVLPAAAASGAVGVIYLTATATETDASVLSTTASNTYNVKDTVLADAVGVTDALYDAKHSDDSSFTVNSAVLTVLKSSAVIDDGIDLDNGSDGPTGDAREYTVPGAIMEYTVTIANAAGAATATDITISDSLVTEIGNGTLAYSAGTINVTAPNINGGANKSLTDASDVDEGDFGATAANTVTVSGITLAAGESATVKFRVVIQ